MNEKQIKQYYERIEKLLNGANKETYGFVPEEIRQILKCYEYLQQRIDNAIEYINNCLIGYKEQYEEHTFNYPFVSYDLENILEILKGETNDKTNKENN